MTSLNEARAELSFANSGYSSHVLLKEQHNNTVRWGLSAKGNFSPCCSVPLNAKGIKQIVPSVCDSCVKILC